MTAPIASIIIPIAPYHLATAERAIASAAAQTVACEIIPVVDDEARGPAWARNRGIEQATTDFAVFLDADDWLLPTFAERCWQMQQQTQRYVFTDFTDQHGRYYAAPECPWVDELWHAVTVFLPMAWVREVDGFDEDLREGGEDSEFFMHLCSSGHCGARLPEALFVYANAPDTRSKRWVNSPARLTYDAMIKERYLSKGKTAMGCCAEPAKKLLDPNAATPRMVLARPKWGGNRTERGLVTGTRYPPADRSQVIEIDPRDAAARPDLWDVIRQPTPVAPTPPMIAIQPTPDLAALAQRALQIKPPPYQPPTPPPPAPIVPAQPNVERVTRLAQRAVQQQGEWRGETAHDQYFVPPDALATEQALKELQRLNDKTSHYMRPVMPPQAWAPQVDRALKHAPFNRARANTADPVFVFPDKDYPSYTDVRRLVELSGFETWSPSKEPPIDAETFIWLSPEQPIGFHTSARFIWWSLEYGGEYEPDLTNWRGEVWASDPAWAKAHDAKMVVMGSHAGLQLEALTRISNRIDTTMLGYMTPRREAIQRQLADLRWPDDSYPGYGAERHQQLKEVLLMLHVHQRDDVAAIAPQRIALAAAYQLPLIAEYVADAGEYGQYVNFVKYENLNGEVRSQLAMLDTGMLQARAERLYQWLCIENTFRVSVEKALKS